MSNESSFYYSRRKDHGIREAVGEIQKLLYDPLADKRLCKLLLHDAIRFSTSMIGTCVRLDEAGRVLEQLSVCQHSSGDMSEQACPLRLDAIEQYILNNAIGQRPVFYNETIPPELLLLLHNPATVTNLLLLPLVHRGRIAYLLVLQNPREEYNATMVARIIPLIGAVGCVISSVERIGTCAEKSALSYRDEFKKNAYLNTLMLASPMALMVLDKNDAIVLLNPKAEQVFAVSDESAHGMDVCQLFPGYHGLFNLSRKNPRWKMGIEREDGSDNLHANQIGRTIQGSEFIMDVTAFRCTVRNERLTTLMINDVSHEQNMVHQHKQVSQQYRALTHLVSVGILQINYDWQCVFANDRWYELSGLSYEESQQTGWINAIHPDDVSDSLTTLRDQVQKSENCTLELRLLTPLGNILWVELNARAVYGDDGEIDGFLGTFADITERLETQERLRHIAEYDALTGLVNRALFNDRLEQALLSEARHRSGLAVFFLDLDGFKDINDSLGHEAGDELLKQVANRLINTLRKSDTIARFGGDEFVILSELARDSWQPGEVAQKIIDQVAQPYMLGDNEVFITVSIGIAFSSSSATNAEQILKYADTALYQAKANGKNNYCYFTKEMDLVSQQRIYLINHLRRGLQTQSFFTAYQLQADIHTDKIIGAEALLRWRNPKGEIIPPVHFIHILEETGLILPVGNWLIRDACKQLARWQKKGFYSPYMSLSINLSPKQLRNYEIVSFIRQCCVDEGVDPKNLIMEITESVLIDEQHHAGDILKQLKGLGVRIALDDFGTGYSSLGYLQKFPIDHIKIDRSFIRDIVEDDADEKIVIAIIALAKSLGLKSTAEGVDTYEKLKRLRYFGCDYFQGYYLSKPMEPKQLEEFKIPNIKHSPISIVRPSA